LREPLPTRVEGLPELPRAYAAALTTGLHELGLVLSPVGRQAIDDHVRLLLAWNAAINLTAIREPAAIALRHVVDSLTAIPLLGDVDGFMDLGSGGGFPGIPLAAALPVGHVALVDSVGKKAAFLAAAVEVTGLSSRVGVAAARAEQLASEPRHRERWPAVTARAVGSLAALVELAFPLLAVGGRLVAWKGGDVAAEKLAARRAVDALGGGAIDEEPVAVTGLAGHRLVVVTKHGRTSDAYPRDPAARRRQPW
jgi:16S rRNA (guanine527-N7)-methyltransferase